MVGSIVRRSEGKLGRVEWNGVSEWSEVKQSEME